MHSGGVSWAQWRPQPWAWVSSDECDWLQRGCKERDGPPVLFAQYSDRHFLWPLHEGFYEPQKPVGIWFQIRNQWQTCWCQKLERKLTGIRTSRAHPFFTFWQKTRNTSLLWSQPRKVKNFLRNDLRAVPKSKLDFIQRQMIRSFVCVMQPPTHRFAWPISLHFVSVTLGPRCREVRWDENTWAVWYCGPPSDTVVFCLAF